MRLVFGLVASTLASSCNLLQNINSTLTIYTWATPYTPLEYVNDCPYSATASVQEDFDYYRLDRQVVWVPPLSSAIQRVRCFFSGKFGDETTNMTITTSDGEAKTIEVTCVYTPYEMPLQLEVDVPDSGVTTGSISVIAADAIPHFVDFRYIPYPVSRVANEGYSCLPCSSTTTTTSGTHKRAWVDDVWNGFCDMHEGIGVFPTSDKCLRQQSSSECGFTDIRSNSEYTIITFHVYQTMGVETGFPFLNTLFNDPIMVWWKPLIVVEEYRRFDLSASPGLPNADIPSFISALWVNYTSVGEVGFINEDGEVTVQWTDLTPWEGAQLTVQIGIDTKGDFKIRSGRCTGDFHRLLDKAVTGYQATDPYGQTLMDRLHPADPCNVAVDCSMTFRTEIIDQVVSDWFQPSNTFNATDSTLSYEVYPVTYGKLAPKPQGEIQMLVNHTLVQATPVWGRHRSWALSF